MTKVNVSSLSDFAQLYEKVIEITPTFAQEPLKVRIRRGISPDSCRATMTIVNPLVAIVAEKGEDEVAKKAQRSMAQAIDFLRKGAELALVEPTWAEIGKYIQDDLAVLNQIFAEATGLDLFKLGGIVRKDGTFRPDSEGNTKE